MVACYANQLPAQLAKGLPGLVLLWGDDAGALKQTAQSIIDKSGLDPNDPFAADKLTLNDLISDPTTLADRAVTLPFGVSKRLITLTGISGDESPREALAILTDAVKTTLERPLDAALIILPIPKLLDKASPLVKAVENHPNALSVRFFTDNARDLATYLQTAFRAAGKPVEPAAMQLLAQHLGADREIAAREVEKLLLYAADEPAITEEHVRACVAGAIPADVFKLAEAVGARNRALTDRLTQHLIAQGEDLNQAFTATVRHLQRLESLQQAQQQGQSLEDAARALRPPLPPSVQKELITQARSYPAKRLATLPQYATETLLQARAGLVPPELPLSRALLALSS